MYDQAQAWSKIASRYEQEFIDPYRGDVHNPMLRALRQMRGLDRLTAADFGCGLGPLLPFLAERFQAVWGVDFAPEMIAQARQRCASLPNVRFLEQPFGDLSPLYGQIDVATSVNSLVLPDVRQLDEALVQIRRCLRPGGKLFGIVPSLDGVHYHTMLLLDRALRSGKPLDAARMNAASLAEHGSYCFAFGRFHFQGIEQHFWQPFEIPYRLKRAGFKRVQMRKTLLSWKQFSGWKELQDYPPPWDWCFLARV